MMPMLSKSRLPAAARIGRRRWVLGAACLLPTLAGAQTPGRPLVVELFTSQGCSSCPPADAIVAGLARTRPDILPLTLHVTYWNSLGWRDPFSLDAATERQQRYVAQAVSRAVYTPALVIDGRRDVVGSDEAAVQAGLAAGAAELQTPAPVQIAQSGSDLIITVGAGTVSAGTVSAGTGHGTVVLLGYDGQHRTAVGRGENGGRTLLEANIVRSIAIAGTWQGSALRLPVHRPAGEKVAVIVQADDGRILGAARR